MSLVLAAVRRSTLAALAALAVATSALPAAAASPTTTMSGWGVRGDASFMGTVRHHTDGAMDGHFTIVVHKAGEEPTLCRYFSFRPLTIYPGGWSFEATGTCYTKGISFPAQNRISIGDNGSPGADYIDVNYYGAVGVSIPGGVLDEGDIVYTP